MTILPKFNVFLVFTEALS